jgi:single-strand DNA-binding protein
MSFNKIILVGNLGKDPELKYTPQGKAVCNFSMATTEKRKDGNDVTTWLKITLWDKMAENAAKYLFKGTQVYIEGRLRTEEWTDRDGKTRTSLEVSASDMQFIGGNSNQNNSEERSVAGGQTAPAQEFATKSTETPADDDIPF